MLIRHIFGTVQKSSLGVDDFRGVGSQILPFCFMERQHADLAQHPMMGCPDVAKTLRGHPYFTNSNYIFNLIDNYS